MKSFPLKIVGVVVATFLLQSLAGLKAQGIPDGAHGADQAEDAMDNIEGRPPIWARGRVRATPFLATSPGGYTPAQIRHAYGLDQITGDGAGQTIAIVDAYGNPAAANDLAVFCNSYGLPAATLNIYYPSGRVTTTNSGWALETNLDLQWAHVIAPKAKLALIVAKSASISNLLSAVDYAVKNVGAKVVSMSWGANEFSSEASYDSHFNKAGVSFFASSGDSGAGVLWPCVSPYVVAVGGTTLSLDSSGNVLSETAWSGSGGGVSAYVTKPAYQNNWQSASKRTVPDVSYNADPYTGYPVYISNYNGQTGWIIVGGTSAGAPQVAAIQAIVNAGRTTSLSSANTAYYGIGVINYTGCYRDIISGSNGAYTATGAYDMVTGLGSTWAPSVVTALTTW